MFSKTVGSRPGGPQLASAPVDAARRLGVGRTTIFRLMKEGKLPAVKIGARTVIPEEAITAFLAGLPRR